MDARPTAEDEYAEQTDNLPQFAVNDVDSEISDNYVLDFSMLYTNVASNITQALPESRQRSLALTALEESYLWVKQTIAMSQDVL